MAFIGTERSHPVLLQPAKDFGEAAERRSNAAPAGIGILIFAVTLGAFWIGAAVAYIWGYAGPGGLSALPLQDFALAAFATFGPPVLIVASAWAFEQGRAMTLATESFSEASERLFSADETASRTAARLGRAVRRELDALNTGLDAATGRMRALESVLETQISALDEASARAGVRTEAAAVRLTNERERLDHLSASLSDAAARASELVASRAAQLKGIVETAEGGLKSAGQLLETQAANFRAAAQTASEAPQSAAAEIDRQAQRIESVSDTALARAEFLLGRHERHRAAMGELLQRLKEEAGQFETAFANQRAAMEEAIGALSGQAKVFETMAGETERQLESVMSAGAARATQLTASFGREAEKVKETCESATGNLARLVTSLHEAGASAQALIGETSAEAKSNAKALVGEAMGECQKLVRTANELASETNEIRESLIRAAADVEKHLVSLPGVARQEASRVREAVRAETEEMLDLSARTLSTIHARSTVRIAPGQERTESEPERENEGLLGLARKLAQRPRRKEQSEQKPWEMSMLLSAAESGAGGEKALKPAVAAALGALEAALADIAIDLDSIDVNGAPEEDDWRRYLAGDRTVFARRIAGTLDETAIARIATLHRESARFREASETYVAEFEAMLERAREGDNGGLLASTLLGADTGKIYLAIAYALGRLSS